MVIEIHFNLGHIIVKFDDEEMSTCMGSRARGGAQPEMPDFRGFAAGDAIRGW